jgi:hypothetical protein
MVNNAKQNKKKSFLARVYLNLCRILSLAGATRRQALRRISDVSFRRKVGKLFLCSFTPHFMNFPENSVRRAC